MISIQGLKWVFMGLFFAMQFHMLNQYQHNIFQERAFTHIMVGTIWFLVNRQVPLWKEPMMCFYSMLIWSMLTIRSCLDGWVVWMGWSVAAGQQNSGWVGWSSVAAGQQNSGWLVNFLCCMVSCLMFYMVIILEEEEEDGQHE